MGKRTVIVRDGLIYKKRTQVRSLGGGHVPRCRGRGMEFVGEAGGKKAAHRYVRRRYEEERPRKLIWEPWNGPDIDSKHPWDTAVDQEGNSPDASLELWSDKGEQYLKASLIGALWAFVDISWRDTYIPSSPKPQGLVLKLQISATIAGASCIDLAAGITLIIGDEHGEYVYLVLAVCSGFVLVGPNQHYIGDNGGAEQTIDLTDYGLADSVCSVRIHLNAKEGWSGNYLCNYIHFTN